MQPTKHKNLYHLFIKKIIQLKQMKHQYYILKTIFHLAIVFLLILK